MAIGLLQRRSDPIDNLEQKYLYAPLSAPGTETVTWFPGNFAVPIVSITQICGTRADGRPLRIWIPWGLVRAVAREQAPNEQ